MAASVMPSSVVGTSTIATPRSQVAATKPARSVSAPPPMATIASVLPMPAAASRDHRPAATLTSLATSPSGTGSACTWYPAPVSTSQAERASPASPAA
jgi:hypothetical protein